MQGTLAAAPPDLPEQERRGSQDALLGASTPLPMLPKLTAHLSSPGALDLGGPGSPSDSTAQVRLCIPLSPHALLYPIMHADLTSSSILPLYRQLLHWCSSDATVGLGRFGLHRPLHRPLLQAFF